MKSRAKRAFTVIELVIVIAVVAVLSVILIPTFGGVIQQANDTAASLELRDIKAKLEIRLSKENPWIINDGYGIEIQIHRNPDGTLWALYNESEYMNINTALNICPELDGYGSFSVSGTDLIYTTKNGIGKARWSNIVGERPTLPTPPTEPGATPPTVEPPVDDGKPAEPPKGFDPDNYSKGLSFTFIESMGGYFVSDIGDCADEVLSIPPYYVDGNVIGISPYAFAHASKVTKVIIPDGIEIIGIGAFSYCQNLTYVEIGSSVTALSVGMFSNCTSLTEIKWPDSITKIGGNAFYGCRSLETINIPNGVTEICNNAFERCDGLLSINIPDSVTSIGDRTFSRCTSLASIEIPSSVKSIGEEAFSGCSALTSIEIPDSVTNIGNSAFRDCKSLRSVTISNSVTEISQYAFQNCTSLSEINIPDSVTTISWCAFYRCTSLTTVTIPENVEEIQDSAFRECTSLTAINYKGTVEQWNLITKADMWDDNTGDYSVYCIDNTISKDQFSGRA